MGCITHAKGCGSVLAVEHPLSIDQLPDAVQRAVGPSAPGPARMMAARGLAPLPPSDLLTALYALSFDPDDKLRSAAAATLTKLPEKILLPALDGLVLPHVLDHAATAFGNHPAALERIVLNQGTDPETIEVLAKGASEKLTELIAVNEARLLGHPGIIEALYLNKHTRMSTATRLVELAVRNGVVLSGLDAFKEIAAAIGQELIPEASEEPLPTDLDFIEAHQAGSDEAEVIEPLPEDAPETEEQIKEKFAPLHYKLAQMSISEKIRMAMLGTPAHRALLVRDPNRLVHMSAIRSPAVSEREVEAILKNRAIPEEVVRYIASKREWLRHYNVKIGLVFNPKTPLATAIHFLPYLRVGELRNAARSKAIPASVVQAAKELLKKKSGGGNA